MSIATIADIESIEREPLEDQNLPENTYDAIRRTAKENPELTALRFFLDGNRFKETHDWTYRELFADITRTANAFHQLGIRGKDVVAFVLPNLPETHFTIWGGEAAGIVMAINPLLEEVQIGDLLRIAKAKVIVTLAPDSQNDLWKKISSQLNSLPNVTGVAWVSLAPYLDKPKADAVRAVAAQEKSLHAEVPVYDFRELIAEQPAERLISGRTIKSSDHSSYFHTGGTTGIPKIAIRTHGGEVYDSWAMKRIRTDIPAQIYFCGLPLFHVNGQVVTGLLPWMRGCSIVLGTPQGYRGPGVLDHFWEMVEHFRFTYFAGVPTIFAALLSRPVGNHDISSLINGLCGAAPMPVELFREFERETGIIILEGYGLTEGTCTASANPTAGEHRVGSIGLRLPYQQMKAAILDSSGKYVRWAKVDEAGAILLHGPNVFAGYLDPVHNTQAWVEIDGKLWLNTGDLGREDAESYFWLTGRKKELIIRGGHNIDPKQIEESIQTHPAVSLVAAVGSPDIYAGEVPVAYVQLRPGVKCDPETLLDYAKRHIHELPAVPKRVEIVDMLPVTAVGKIFKPALLMREIERAVRKELAEANLSEIPVTVVQDSRLGLVARIAMNGKDFSALSHTLGRYTFAVDWIEPVSTTVK